MRSKNLWSQRVFAIMMLTFLIIILFFPASNSNQSRWSPDGLYFEDVNIFIIGRCRSKSSSGEWSSNLFIGGMSQAGIGVYDTYSEKLNILIYNQTFAKGFIRLLNKDVNMDEPKGIFFWGAWRGFSSGIFPPIIFVICYAKKMWISPTYTPIT